MTKPHRLLFIAHAPSPNTVALRDGLCASVRSETEVELVVKPPFEATAEDALGVQGIIIGTTENIGSMAGATKDFFDRSYYQLLDSTAGMPVAVYIRAGLDGTGTERGLRAIIGGLRWRLAAEPLILKGDWREEFSEQASELGLVLAAGLELGLY